MGVTEDIRAGIQEKKNIVAKNIYPDQGQETEFKSKEEETTDASKKSKEEGTTDAAEKEIKIDAHGGDGGATIEKPEEEKK